MKLPNIPGDHAFKALYKYSGTWEVSQHYFLSYEEAKKFYSTIFDAEFKWPIIFGEDGVVYIPTKEEME